MRIRTLLGAAAAAAALLIGLAVPATATERTFDGCPRADYTYLVNNDGSFCFRADAGPEILHVNIDHVNWVHAGDNRGHIDFFGADNKLRRYYFSANSGGTGCDDCWVRGVRLDRP